MVEANLLRRLNYEILQQCMHCGMCLPTCPTFDETKRERSSPRGRIRLMREIADGRLDASPLFAEEMSYCLGCLACQSACPAGVDYSTLFESARGEIERQRIVKGAQRRFLRWLMLAVVFRHPRLLRALGRAIWLYQRCGLQRALRAAGVMSLLPERCRRLEQMTPTVIPPFSHARIKTREAPIDVKYRVALLTGCVQDLLYAPVNRATADVLIANQCEVVAPAQQYCCGSLHAHNGELDLARDLARKNLDAFDVANLDAVITNAGGCGSHLRRFSELLHDDPQYRDRAADWDAKVRDIHEWLVEIDFRRPASRGPRLSVTYDASCHLLHGCKVAAQPLAILESIPGVRLLELREADWCCGSAGLYSLTQPEQSAKLLARKLDYVAATKAQILATGNPGCLLQLQMGVQRDPRLSLVRVCHPVELLAEAYRRELHDRPESDSKLHIEGTLKPCIVH